MDIAVHHLVDAMKAGRCFNGKIFAEENGIEGSKGPLPPWLKPFHPPFQQASFEIDPSVNSTAKANDTIPATDFEIRAALARERASGVKRKTGDDWPKVKRTVLLEALAIAARDLAVDPPNGAKAVDLLLMRTGLQLYGVEIVPDDATDVLPLDLANGEFPFSLRFICCVVRVPLALSNLNLVTLDLSGSALVGVDGSFLRARGSVRMRNCFSSAPIDFGGAQIHGYFDGCDALLQPFGKLPAGQAVDGDRGMLNLNQASIDNEVRLARAIIWGGLSIRGLTTQRSLILNEAVLLSPLAVLEEMLLKSEPAEVDDFAIQDLPKIQKSETYIEKRESLAQRGPIGEFKEVFDGLEVNWRASCFNVLMSESLKIRTTALRADGLKVGGSIFALNILCRGRLRMKYANIEGSISLQGGSLSSAEFQRRNFDRCGTPRSGSRLKAICDYRIATYKFLVGVEQAESDELAREADDFALDLRETRFGGSVRIGTLPSKFDAKTKPKTKITGPITKIDGVIALERANIDGELIFDAVEFAWTCRVKKTDNNSDCEIAVEHFEKERDTSVQKGDQSAVQARGIVTGDSISFNGSSGLNGVDFTNAEIGGDFSFFKKMKKHDKEDKLKVTSAAHELVGQIKIEGARIAGDCKLIFDKADGPHIKAERVEVAGALIISGPPTYGTIGMAFSDYERLLSGARTKQKDLRKAAKADEDWFELETGEKALPKIDLGNATAGFIQHPPAAWPQAGRLLITGFKYKRALDYGPLAPHPFASNRVGSKTGAELSVGIFIFGLVSFGLFLFYSWRSKAVWVEGHFGENETISTAIFLFISAAYCFIKHFTNPRRHRNLPMAIAWLSLQTAARNSYRTPGNIYSSLEPYAVAAQALREEGRWISANFVEEHRLRVREQQLSWRINMFQKFLSKLMSGVNNYGFSLSRPIFLIGLMIASGALLAHDAGKWSAISEKTYRTHATVSAADACPDVQRKHLPTGFNTWLYAVDKIVPAVEFGQDSNWELCKTAAPWDSAKWLTYEILFAGLRLMGLAIAGLLLLALSTRLGLVFNRYNE